METTTATQSPHAQARAAGLWYLTALAYNQLVVARLAVAIRANGGTIDGPHDPEPMGDGIIVQDINTALHVNGVSVRLPYTAKIGDAWTRFATFAEALEFAVYVRAELAEIAA